MTGTISKVCSIARNLKIYQNKSVIQLLKESGYFENSSSITIEDIEQYLIDHPSYVNDWINFSSDKRTSEGWYFLQEGPDWIVGYLEDTTNGFARIREEKFPSSIKACAVFIMKETNNLKLIYLKEFPNL